MLNNRYLDYSIIDINTQRHVNIEKIKGELNKEFKWHGLPLAFHTFKKTLGSFMKREHVRLKQFWVKNP
jgi:hypothetical protein